MSPTLRIPLLAAAAAFLAAACGDDPVTYSAPVEINLKAKSADTVNDTVADQKGITSEPGNPFGQFITDAQDALGGADPSRIELASLELLLGANSTGVTTLEEIFDGTVDVLLVTHDANNSFPAATTDIVEPVGGGPIDFDATFDSADMGAADYDRLLTSAFDVAIRGPAAAEFTTKGADADLQLTFTFQAFE
ncbi:MAG TPA: hypothetical protein VL172_06840 [Kofleriaceae bacterium]|nr:hypothetical protein [Kofleriaceae bacterium]